MEWLKVTVICLLICVLKCSAMTISEIEEFSNFLEKTAQLDEILKKGNPDHDYDDEEAVSDDAWEQSGKFEGDLILNDRQRRLIVQDVVEGLSRNGLRDSTKRWPDNEVIYYIQKEHFSGDQMQAIQNGIDDLAQASCIKFRPYRKGDRDAVVIQGSRRGCFSQVGYQGGYQVLNLSGRHPVGRGCFRHGTVVHELLHTLGFYHMQSSPDRDDYIDVVWENIVEPAKHNFRKYNTFSVTDFGVGYDYDSVLHYSRRAFSKNGQDTLVPKKSGASIGQRIGLSDKDTQKLNKMYCDADNDNVSADEEAPQKSPTKKKTPKNKPFQGHGIGYHQGKTIVIKLAPAAQTYKLDDKPKFHVFDHFSKTPQAVSSAVTEGTGVGEEITYHHDPFHYNLEDYRKFSTRIIPDIEKEKTIEQKEYPDTAISIVKNDDNKNVNSMKPKDTYQLATDDASSNHKDDINETFDRLGKIIKTHVYPSQTPDLQIYKTKTDYSHFYNPAIKYEPEPEVVQIDKAFGSTSVPADIGYKNGDKINLSERKEVSNDEGEDDKKTVELFDGEGRYDPNHLSKQFDSSYGTSYPLNKMPKVKLEKFITPEYATLQHLANKHDYSSFYKPRDEDESRNGKHNLFGYVVPVHDKWFNNDDIKKDNEKYEQDSYTYPAEKEQENVSAKLQYKPAESEKRSLFGRDPSGQAYSIFGVLVPLTQKWYKVDYHPHTGSYLIEKPESSEDYR